MKRRARSVKLEAWSADLVHRTDGREAGAGKRKPRQVLRAPRSTPVLPTDRLRAPREWLLRHNFDYVLVVALAALVGFGLVMVYSASYIIAYTERNDPYFFVARQALWIVLGSVLMVVVAQVPYHRWERLAVPGLVAAVTLLLVVQFTPLGVESGGARRWLRLEPLTPIQPSDFVKLALILFLASYLARNRDRLRSLRHGLLPLVVIVGGIAALIVAERDLSTVVIILVTAIVMFLAAGADLVQLAALGLAGAGFVAILTVAEPYRLQRVLAFLDPVADAQHAGYQVSRILGALASGGLTGRGLGASREKYEWLPSAHADSIFAVIGEELGLVGCLLLLALFGVLIYRGYRAALRSPDHLGFLLGTGITTWLAFQALVNVAGTTRLLPLSGVPLPFISSGGSSMVACLIGVGFLLNISRHRTEVTSGEAERPQVYELVNRRSLLRYRPEVMGESASSEMAARGGWER